jgi:signal transduction histidine kinase
LLVAAAAGQGRAWSSPRDIRFDVPRGLRAATPPAPRQVLVNLLGNAVKFTDRGQRSSSACSEICTCRIPDALQLSVTGHGHRFARRQGVTTIFDSFTQVDTSTTRRYGGTG